jgi:sulfur carrier protein
LNGAERPVNAATVAALIAELAIPGAPRGLAVALNGAVVPRARWAASEIKAGDAIEIVRAAQGG